MKYLSLAFLLIAVSTFAQKENRTNCAKRDHFSNAQLKSNTLTVAQIAKTEKYDVHYYGLDLNMTNTTTTLSGNVEMRAIAVQALDTVLFELFSTMTITSIELNGNVVPFIRSNSAVKIAVNFPSGTSFTVKTFYNGTPPTAQTNPLGGSGMTNASSPTWGNEVVWSLSEPFSAYEWFPCKQSLTDKADSCDVKITVPNSCKAGSNGTLVQVVNLGNGNSRYEWKHRYPIDYYLISVSIAHYIEYNIYANPVGAPSPILIQNFIYDNPQTLINFQTEIDETATMIELYYDLFGPYPFENEKYGHCMAPIGGGMEHQTMTTQGSFSTGLTCHELAHQWWGDYVTCASWCDIWLNEGFASYGEQITLENLYPGQEVQNMAGVHNNVMSQAGGSTWVLDSLNEARIFDGRLTYDKGAAIIHTIRYITDNDSLFFATLRDFLISNAYNTAYGIDVRDAFSQATGYNFTPYFEQWYFGEGFPTYSVEWKQSGNDAYVRINHTVSMPNITPTFTNPIDLKFTRPGQSDTTIRFDITSNSNTFLIPEIGTINNGLSIDPLNWVVNQAGSITMNNALAIQEVSVNALEVYPNPTANQFTITHLTQKSKIEIYNMLGKVVLSKDMMPGEQISTMGLESGHYLVKIYEGKNQFAKLLTKF
jgi:aminopeptidase N